MAALDETGSQTTLDETGSQTNNANKEHRRRASIELRVGTAASGSAYAPSLATSGTTSTGGSVGQTVSRHRKSHAAPAPQPKVSHRLRAMLSSAIENIDRAIDTGNDDILRDNAIAQTGDALADLWAERSVREEQFAQVINMFQNLLLGRRASSFTTDQFGLIRSALVRVSDESVLDDDCLTQITMDLLKGDIDVFRELD